MRFDKVTEKGLYAHHPFGERSQGAAQYYLDGASVFSGEFTTTGQDDFYITVIKKVMGSWSWIIFQ